MSAEQLLEQFHHVGDAPDAIPRLRRFILYLAVRGKLVPQDPSEKPASELLKRIANKKVSQADLPTGWVRATVGALLDFQYGKGMKAGDRAEKGPVPVFGSNGIVGFTDEPLTICPSIIVGRKGSAGALNLCNGPSWTTDVAYFVEAPPFLEVRFLLNALAALDLGKLGKGVKPGLSRSDAYEQLMCVPPLAEQHRIVAKVEELNSLCDRLATARAQREATRDRLTATSLARLNMPDPAPAVFADHGRFALRSFAALTTRPDQVPQIRQTILNLAVFGKLVPQNLNEEAAPDLLQRIHRYRKHKRAIAQLDVGKLKLPPSSIPANWTWTVIDQVAADCENAITDGPFGASLKTAHYVTSPGFRVIRLQNIGPGFFRDEHRSYIDGARFNRLSKHHVKGGDLVVAGLVDPRVRCCQVPADIGPALVKADCYRFSVHPRISSRFALHYLNSPVAQAFAAAHHHGMTLTRIGLGNFRQIPFPLPPGAEQHRIVAKVDELMTLCDRLEASLATGDAGRSILLDALIAEALALDELDLAAA